MDSCCGCQAKLEEIATEGTNLSQVVKQLDQAEPMATSAYWPVQVQGAQQRVVFQQVRECGHVAKIIGGDDL